MVAIRRHGIIRRVMATPRTLGPFHRHQFFFISFYDAGQGIDRPHPLPAIAIPPHVHGTPFAVTPWTKAPRRL